MAIRIRQSTASERAVPGGRRVVLDFSLEGELGIPAVLLLPARADHAPGAVLLHGFTSRKEHMADTVGRALLEHGIASLAVDLPLHGSRSDSLQTQSARNPLEIARHWRQALGDTALALGYLGARKEIDRARLALVGYSLGSFLAVAVAADEPRVRAVVLAAGGDPTVRPDQAGRLFAAAAEPKTISWWDAGHALPEAATAEAASWLDAQLQRPLTQKGA